MLGSATRKSICRTFDRFGVAVFSEIRRYQSFFPGNALPEISRIPPLGHWQRHLLAVSTQYAPRTQPKFAWSNNSPSFTELWERSRYSGVVQLTEAAIFYSGSSSGSRERFVCWLF